MFFCMWVLALFAKILLNTVVETLLYKQQSKRHVWPYTPLRKHENRAYQHADWTKSSE